MATATRCGGLLAAGASPDGDPADEHPPLANAAWRGDALHGSHHCQHPEGGPTMATVEEIDRDRYAATVRVLLDGGATVPASFGQDGGPSAATLLAELGVSSAG